jgi:hypothetical protein
MAGTLFSERAVALLIFVVAVLVGAALATARVSIVSGGIFRWFSAWVLYFDGTSSHRLPM